MSGREARGHGLTTALLLLPFRVITLANRQRRGRRGSGTVPVWSYLAGEGARAGAFGFGVLDSAVLVGIEHPSCKTTDGLSRLATAVPPSPCSSRPGLSGNTGLVCLSSGSGRRFVHLSAAAFFTPSW